MKIVSPRIFHLSATTTDAEGEAEFLDFHKVPDWTTEAASGAERLIELAGRRCYQSFQTETVPVSKVNPNLSKVRTGNKTYINNILKIAHGSVIEHATDTYAIEDITRVFTHEVVRHRLCAFSQESLRFVRPTSLRAYFPDAFKNMPNGTERRQVEALFEGCFKELENIQRHLVNLIGMDTVQRTFGDKKKLQSAMRRLMPIGMATGIIMTTNHRNWRHLIALRTVESAEEEIRKVFGLIAEDLLSRYPALYQDMNQRDGEYTFEHGRV